MNFENLEKTWESFAKHDPLWAILAWESKKNNNWNVNEFFQIGIEEIEYIFHESEKRKKIKSRQKSLDFGCGVGRLTFPLGDFFAESHGLDISSTMIQKAEKFKQQKDKKNCFFHVNKRNDLTLFPDSNFDYILSIIVLQHMEPQYAFNYISEFLRILKNDALCVLQLPDKTENRAHYEDFVEDTEPIMEMFGVDKADVIAFVEKSGGKILDVIEDLSCGSELKSYRYFLTK